MFLFLFFFLRVINTTRGTRKDIHSVPVHFYCYYGIILHKNIFDEKGDVMPLGQKWVHLSYF